MTGPSGLREPRGSVRSRRGRADYALSADQADRAKRIRFTAIGNNRIECLTSYGRYVIENTYDGVQPVRARRNGSLILYGMCKTELEARLAVAADIARRKAIDNTAEAAYISDIETDPE